MAFVSMMPKSSPRLDLLIRIVSGLMGISAAVFWLLGETKGDWLRVLIVMIPMVGVVIAGMGVFLAHSMWDWERAVKERGTKSVAQSDKSKN